MYVHTFIKVGRISVMRSVLSVFSQATSESLETIPCTNFSESFTGCQSALELNTNFPLFATTLSLTPPLTTFLSYSLHTLHLDNSAIPPTSSNLLITKLTLVFPFSSACVCDPVHLCHFLLFVCEACEARCTHPTWVRYSAIKIQLLLLLAV